MTVSFFNQICTDGGNDNRTFAVTVCVIYSLLVDVVVQRWRSLAEIIEV